MKLSINESEISGLMHVLKLKRSEHERTLQSTIVLILIGKDRIIQTQCTIDRDKNLFNYIQMQGLGFLLGEIKRK